MCCCRWRRVAARRRSRHALLAAGFSESPRRRPDRPPCANRCCDLLDCARMRVCVCARSAFVLGHTLGALRVAERDSDPLILLRSGLPLSPGGPAPVGSGERAAIVQTTCTPNRGRAGQLGNVSRASGRAGRCGPPGASPRRAGLGRGRGRQAGQRAGLGGPGDV